MNICCNEFKTTNTIYILCKLLILWYHFYCRDSNPKGSKGNGPKNQQRGIDFYFKSDKQGDGRLNFSYVKKVFFNLLVINSIFFHLRTISWWKNLYTSSFKVKHFVGGPGGNRGGGPGQHQGGGGGRGSGGGGRGGGVPKNLRGGRVQYWWNFREEKDFGKWTNLQFLLITIFENLDTKSSYVFLLFFCM